VPTGEELVFGTHRTVARAETVISPHAGGLVALAVNGSAKTSEIIFFPLDSPNQFHLAQSFRFDSIAPRHFAYFL